MAQPANTFDTYDAVGIREDLSDIIFNISPTDTPFFTGCGRTSAKAVTHEWQTDSLAAAASNAVIEGDEATLDAVTATQRLSNVTQIMDKTAVVTGTQEAVDKAGRTREMAYQVAKKTRELKRDIEFALTNVQGKVVGDNTTARTFGSLPSWIHTNATRGGGGGTNAAFTLGNLDAGSTPTDSTTTATLTESQLQTGIQNAWTQGGDVDTLMCGPANKVIVSGFTANTNVTRFAMTDGKKLVTALDVYVSDFGEHKIVPNRFQRGRDFFGIDFEYWSVSFLRSPRNWPLSKTGDTEKRQVLTELTLESRQEAASFIIADTSV